MLGSSRTRFGSVVAIGLAVGQGGCSSDQAAPDIAALPPARTTLRAVAQRLGQVKKPADLTQIALRSRRVLAELTPAERQALGQSSLRFRVDGPVIVAVAVPESSTKPFWLDDAGFQPNGRVLHDPDGAGFALHERSFPRGDIGLGVNALDRGSDAHYAVFVRADGHPSRPVQVEPVGLEPVVVRPAGRDVSPFEDGDRPLVDLPSDLAQGLVILTRLADRADGALLPFGRAWKTRQPSSPRPDQVVASFGLDPRRELAVSWRTDPTVTRSIAKFAIAGQSHQDRDVLRIEGAAEPIESDGLLNDPTIIRHRVVVTGLRPDTRYAYAVGDGTDGGWSPWLATRTAPATLRDYRFLYLGDAQCELEKWGELAHSAVKAAPDAGFLILAGDLVDRGNERSNWDHFFYRGAGVFDAIPFMPAVGNHEYLDKGPQIYRKTFDLPKNGPAGVAPNLVYSFEYADSFVAVLDSNLAIYDPSAAELQARWLDQALTQTRATWKFVTFHHPIYASHPSRSNPQLGRAWIPIFDKHHVDLVLTGHDHAYLRSKPMFAGQPVADPSTGTVYVVSVSGEKFYGQTPHDYTARGLTHVATYQTIEVAPASRRLQYRSFDRVGHEVDAFSIQKADDPNRSDDLVSTAARTQ